MFIRSLYTNLYMAHDSGRYENAAGWETKDQYKKQREQFRKHTMEGRIWLPSRLRRGGGRFG